MTSLKIKRAAEEIVRKLDLGLGAEGIRENERRIEGILFSHFGFEEPTANTGHGHVWSRPDGLKARCGGEGLCKVCDEQRSFLIHGRALSEFDKWYQPHDRGNTPTL